MLYMFLKKNCISVSQVHLKKKQNLNVLHNSVLFLSFWLLWVFVALHGISLVAVPASLCSGFSCGGARALERVKVCAQLLSHIQLFPNPMDCSLPGSSVHGIFQARNTGVGCHFFLQRNFLTQGSTLCLLHWQADSSP